MLDTRWRKFARDMLQHRSRTLLVLLAVCVGMICAGTLLDTWALVDRATELGFRNSEPVSATLTVDRVDAEIMAKVRAMPEISGARARRAVTASLESQSGARQTALLWALDDYAQTSIARLKPEEGMWPPTDGAVVVERSSLAFSGAAVGQSVKLRWGQSEMQSLPVNGVARDVGLPPGWMDHVVYAFVTPATLAQLGAPSAFNEIQIRVRDASADRAQVRRTGRAVAEALQRMGVRVLAVDVPVPGMHPHAAQMSSLLITQGAFGVLTLLVCAFLVINLVNATLISQSREIAVMKVMGALRAKLVVLYLGQAFALGLAATLIALPPSLFIARKYAAFQGEFLNLPVAEFSIPVWAVALQLVVGLLLPVIAAAVPVLRACGMTAGAALRDIGIVGAGKPLALRRPWVPAGWARPLILSLGNAFRRRQRTSLTVFGLAVAAAVFLGAATMRQAVRASVDQLFSAVHYDASLRITDPQGAMRIESVAASVDGVQRAEAWRATRVIVGSEGEAGDDPVVLLGVRPQGGVLQPQPMKGRWLTPDDMDAIVASRVLARQDSRFALGQTVQLLIDGAPRQWHVVGVVDTAPEPIAYTTSAALDKVMGNTLANLLQVALAPGSDTQRADTVKRLRAALKDAGIPASQGNMTSEFRRAIDDHLLMVVDFLGGMSWVMLAVGGMGLASTMGLAVLERTREIGVMRALGARTVDIFGIVQAEGLVLVVLGWCVALPLSALASAQLEDAFGRVMFSVPARWWPGAGVALEWLAIMTVLSLVVCAGAAWRASRIPAARALAYE
jgi:putative ABC transport system permease protein